MHAGDDAAEADVLYCAYNLRIEVRGSRQLEQRVSRIGARQHSSRCDLLAIRQYDAACFLVRNAELSDSSAVLELRTGGARGVRQRIDDRTSAAAIARTH